MTRFVAAKANEIRSLRPKHFRWSLAIACHNYRNGTFQGWCEYVRIGVGRGNFIYGTDWCDNHEVTLTGPKIRFHCGKTDKAKFGPITFRHRGYKKSVGNWCWDACFVDRRTVREIVGFLKSEGWTVESSSGLLIDWFCKV